MTVRATVLIPTHDHGPTLLYSARSALAQTLPEIELFIVGDGVPDVTRELVGRLIAEDGRVRFFDNPKGPRHGELHRHAALQAARGEIVAYLSDDDIWLPDHLETVSKLLREADFAHALPLRVEADAAVRTWIVDLQEPAFRRLLLSGENRIPLSCAAHTLAMYRSLPEGWRTTPQGTFTDLYMWQQFLSQPGCRFASGSRPTVAHFPASLRRDWTPGQRLEELERWSGRLSDRDRRAEFVLETLEAATAERAQLEVRAESQQTQVRDLAAEVERQGREIERLRVVEVRAESQQTQVRDLAAEVERLRAVEVGAESQRTQVRDLAAEIERLREEVGAWSREAQRLGQELHRVYGLRWWRLRARLLRLPLVPQLVRLAGKVLARPRGR